MSVLSCRTRAARDAELVPHADPGPNPVTSAGVLSGSAGRGRIAGLLAGGAAAVSMGVVGCTTVTDGDAAVNAAEAPAYRTSVSLSSSQSAASSSARESERQASRTTEAIHSACETLSITSADAIDAVNAYVDAFNEEGGNVATTEGPAVDALDQSADAVDNSIGDEVPDDVRDAFQAWIDSASATSEAIVDQAPPSEFNKVIGDLNDARAEALRLCDATYR